MGRHLRTPESQAGQRSVEASPSNRAEVNYRATVLAFIGSEKTVAARAPASQAGALAISRLDRDRTKKGRAIRNKYQSVHFWPNAPGTLDVESASKSAVLIFAALPKDKVAAPCVEGLIAPSPNSARAPHIELKCVRKQD